MKNYILFNYESRNLHTKWKLREFVKNMKNFIAVMKFFIHKIKNYK